MASAKSKLRKGKIVYEGLRLSLAELRRMGSKDWSKRCSGPAFFITGKTREVGLLLGARIPQSEVRAESRRRHQSRHGAAILDSERQKLTHLDFVDKIKLSELLTLPQGGTSTIRHSGRQIASALQRHGAD